MKFLKNFPSSIDFFHLGIALFVTGSIVTSLILDGLSSPEIMVEIHVWFGFGVTLFLLLHWWAIFSSKHRELKRHLFPYNRKGVGMMKEDIRLLLQRRLPPRGYRGGLSGLVEGLGLLAITGMVLTGLTFYLALVNSYVNQFYFVYQTHSFFSGFVYVFYVGHTGMAIIHKLK